RQVAQRGRVLGRRERAVAQHTHAVLVLDTDRLHVEEAVRPCEREHARRLAAEYSLTAPERRAEVDPGAVLRPARRLRALALLVLHGTRTAVGDDPFLRGHFPRDHRQRRSAFGGWGEAHDVLRYGLGAVLGERRPAAGKRLPARIGALLR